MLKTSQKKVGVTAQVADLFRPSQVVSRLPLYPIAVLQDQPVLYLRFEETTGTACADISGNGFSGTTHGTITRNVATKAGLGVGVSYGGTTSDWVDVADNATLDITADFTYECWFKYSSRAASQVLMSKGQTDASNAGYQMYVTTLGFISVDRAYLTALWRETSFAVPNDSAWHHIVATRAANIYTTYLDGGTACGGNQAASGTVATAVQATTRALGIGADFNTAGAVSLPVLSGGSMDEVAVYNKALSAARVAAHFQAATL